jgi:hypothetical protein
MIREEGQKNPIDFIHPQPVLLRQCGMANLWVVVFFFFFFFWWYGIWTQSLTLARQGLHPISWLFIWEINPRCWSQLLGVLLFVVWKFLATSFLNSEGSFPRKTKYPKQKFWTFKGLWHSLKLSLLR